MVVCSSCSSTEAAGKVDLSAPAISPWFTEDKRSNLPTDAIGHHDGTRFRAMAPMPIEGQHPQGYPPGTLPYHQHYPPPDAPYMPHMPPPGYAYPYPPHPMHVAPWLIYHQDHPVLPLLPTTYHLPNFVQNTTSVKATCPS